MNLHGFEDLGVNVDTLTTKELAMYNELIENVESEDGGWGMVYLDNLETSGLTRSGLCGSLETKGLYRKVGAAFGEVKTRRNAE